MKKDVVCDECGEVVLTTAELAAGIHETEGSVVAVCPKCGNVVRVPKEIICYIRRLVRKRSIPCPVCGWKRIGDAYPGVAYETCVEDNLPEEWGEEFAYKCPKCKSEVAIKRKAEKVNEI